MEPFTENKFYQDFDYALLPGGKRGKDDYRSPFQIDRDRILFSYAFRRLQSKTQVFQSGEYDFYRTRLTHTIEVARVARSLCENLNRSHALFNEHFFIDPDLVEAVGLAHDLGHPPFGHIGERKLNELMSRTGGFEGNAQTLRIIANLIYVRPKGPQGMSPTRAFLDGILKYKTLHGEASKECAGQVQYPDNHFLYDEQVDHRQFIFGDRIDSQSLIHSGKINDFKSIECQIMDWADDTAYSIHDIVDGIHAGFLNEASLLEWSKENDLNDRENGWLDALMTAIRDTYFEPLLSSRTGAFIRHCQLQEWDNLLSSTTNRYRWKLVICPEIVEECDFYKRIAFDLIFQSSPIQQIEFKGGIILERLFCAYRENVIKPNSKSLNLLPRPESIWLSLAKTKRERLRILCDYLAGMTDGVAIRAYKRLFDPGYTSIMDLS